MFIIIDHILQVSQHHSHIFFYLVVFTQSIALIGRVETQSWALKIFYSRLSFTLVTSFWFV